MLIAGVKRRGKLETAAQKLSHVHRYAFRGLDFTLAPFPQENASSDGRWKAWACRPSGWLAFRFGFLTDTLDRALHVRFQRPDAARVGKIRFSSRAAENSLSVTDLLLCSAVCGTGLDVIPLPGDTNADQLYPLLLDLAALALRLNKPLTARLLPIPGKKAGDPTEFDFPYFANSRVLPLRSEKVSGALAGAEDVPLAPRYPR